MDKSSSTVLCKIGNSSTEISKDSILFESPTCARESNSFICSRKRMGTCTFDISLAFFQGDTLERDVYVTIPDGPGFWLLNAALYGLREGAKNWYDRFHRHVFTLGFVEIPGVFQIHRRPNRGLYSTSCRRCAHRKEDFQVSGHEHSPSTQFLCEYTSQLRRLFVRREES